MFTKLFFPTRWHYDYLRDAGVDPDERVDEAVELLRSKRDDNRRWTLENMRPTGIGRPGGLPPAALDELRDQRCC